MLLGIPSQITERSLPEETHTTSSSPSLPSGTSTSSIVTFWLWNVSEYCSGVANLRRMVSFASCTAVPCELGTLATRLSNWRVTGYFAIDICTHPGRAPFCSRTSRVKNFVLTSFGGLPQCDQQQLQHEAEYLRWAMGHVRAGGHGRLLGERRPILQAIVQESVLSEGRKRSEDVHK